MLRIVMSVFDPLGFVANLTIRGRILIQDIWRSGIGWDDSIDVELNKTWATWIADLTLVSKLKIPRCYSFKVPEADEIELHVFCDASNKAFAAVVYMRVVTINKEVDVSLLIAKAHVAPTKPLSIPRLKLQDALLGSRLLTTVRNALEIKITNVYLWSDSTTVLYWIKGDGRKLGQFEAHRVGEIQELTDATEWHWVPSALNAADLATRTCDGTIESEFQKWHDGPDFLLCNDKETWPKKIINRDPIEVQLVNFQTDKEETGSQFVLPDITRFSKWSRLIRATGYVFKFARILLSKTLQISTVSENLSRSDLQEAEKKWIMQCQLECFPDEIKCLKKNNIVNSHSQLSNLSPESDEDGIIRVRGRLDLAPDTVTLSRHPIILSPKHRYTQLLLQKYHEDYAHQGIETVLNEVRQKFWVLNGRSAVKSAFKKCQECRRRKSKPQLPEMGQLPTFRLSPNVQPFTYAGVDYFGPLYVTVGRRREKRWGVLFTCLTVRAVHLEVAHSLTTDSTIMAVRRMEARRNRPKEIYSDNGTNLRGAAEELKKAVKELEHDRIKDVLLESETEWKFLPPASPHMAGCWERLVRSVKITFNVLLKGQVLKDELLLTLFAETENIVNSRPLTRVSGDSGDLESLTPNHFLRGTSNNLNYYGEPTCDLRKEWRKSQILIESFWKRWTKEYLPTLTRRSKWNKDGQPIKKDDVVVIVDENVPRKSWKLGKVQTIFPGPDGKVRVVELKTSSGIFRRPVAKLCRIDMED